MQYKGMCDIMKEERYNLASITKKIYESGFYFFKIMTLKDILEIKKESTLFSVVRKLVRAGVLTKIEKNKYVLKSAKVSDFALANFLYSPSYISFESALNFYGILSQFPYEISSATPKKSVQKEFEEKIFTYTKIKSELFWGYEKIENFLIALPEKALLDQIYLVAKGQKNINLDEIDLSKISISTFKKFLNMYPRTRQFLKMIKKLKEIHLI